MGIVRHMPIQTSLYGHPCLPHICQYSRFARAKSLPVELDFNLLGSGSLCQVLKSGTQIQEVNWLLDVCNLSKVRLGVLMFWKVLSIYRRQVLRFP